MDEKRNEERSGQQNENEVEEENFQKERRKTNRFHCIPFHPGEYDVSMHHASVLLRFGGIITKCQNPFGLPSSRLLGNGFPWMSSSIITPFCYGIKLYPMQTERSWWRLCVPSLSSSSGGTSTTPPWSNTSSQRTCWVIFIRFFFNEVLDEALLLSKFSKCVFFCFSSPTATITHNYILYTISSADTEHSDPKHQKPTDSILSV